VRRVLGALLLLAAALCAGRASADCGVVLEPVATGIWRVPAARGRPDAANGGLTIQLVLVREGRRLWLVGSGPTPAFGRALACAARQAAGGPVTDLVNTHVAPELSLGNSAFPRARLWALPEVIAAMHERCGACLASLRDQVGRAGASLDERDAIQLPRRAVRGPRLGPFEVLALARQPGEPTLVLRHRGIVIAQGLLWAGDVPDLYGTNSASLLDSLERLDRFAAGARLLGQQGELADAGAIDAQRRYLLALRGAIHARLAAGEVQGEVPLPGYAGMPGYAQLHPLNVQRVWRELESELFR